MIDLRLLSFVHGSDTGSAGFDSGSIGESIPLSVGLLGISAGWVVVTSQEFSLGNGHCLLLTEWELTSSRHGSILKLSN